MQKPVKPEKVKLTINIHNPNTYEETVKLLISFIVEDTKERFKNRFINL